MPLPTPNLDDRRFQDLVDDAKRLVQQRCPEWTDHNVSDPGVTLIETFASMVDQLLYRLNRVPAAHYVRFLDLLDVQLFPPAAARCELTFRLSAAQPETVTVPAGTPVATPRTETEEPVVVTTVDDLPIVPSRLVHVATSVAGQQPVDRTERWACGDAVAAFGETPSPGDAVLFGLSDAVPRCAVLLRLECEATGANIDPVHPPVAWEAWDGARWIACEVDRDDTGGLNRSGDVVLHVPAEHTLAAVRRDRAGWLRCRATEARPGVPFYTAAPRVLGARASTIGGTVVAVHAETVHDEVLGLAEGVPGQRFTLRHRPVVPGGPPLCLEVGSGPGAEEWNPVEHFGDAGPHDPVFRMEWGSGEVVLGPVVRQQDGTLRQYGKVPPKGAPVRIRAYRSGGGRRGNVAQGLLRVQRVPVPFVTSVENRCAATGGVDGETVTNAAVRAPLELRTADRAVTTEDFELVTRQVAPEIARVRCLRVGEGETGEGVRVLLVPRVAVDESGRLPFGDLLPDRETVAAVGRELDRRRCIGARVVVEPPYYQGVTVAAVVQARPRSDGDLVKARALAALYRFLNPVVGGPDGAGWPFGRPVQTGEIFSVLQALPDVEMVEEIELYGADPITGERSPEPTHRIDLRPQSLVYSFAHDVLVTAAG